MKILFMGTPEFSIYPLKYLIESGFEVVAVITQPDKPAKRGKKITPPPVKEFALSRNLKVFQPESLKKSVALSVISKLSFDYLVTVAYGKIVPEWILNIPKMSVNVHPSLLPKYRGPAPINWAIINGEQKTGVSIMEMVKELDAGDIFLQKDVEIFEDETAGELSERLSKLSGELLVEFFKRIKNGDLIEKVPQDNSLVTYAPMLDKKIARIDWRLENFRIHNLVRGLNPWPVAYTFFRDKMCKIYRTKKNEIGCKGRIPGEIFSIGGKMLVCCGNFTSLEVLEIQMPGKRVIRGIDFLNGNRVLGGERFL